jgi:tRNA-specific 2-thiouridylase
VNRYRGEQDTAGELVDTAGTVLGHHEGYERYTIGQRKRLGITFGEPRFVVAIEPRSRRVVIGKKEDLARTELEADRPNWLAADVPSRFTCQAQIRYRHDAAKADVEVIDENRFRVRFTDPQYGVAPGQALVLYDGDRVLGCGWIR